MGNTVRAPGSHPNRWGFEKQKQKRKKHTRSAIVCDALWTVANAFEMGGGRATAAVVKTDSNTAQTTLHFLANAGDIFSQIIHFVWRTDKRTKSLMGFSLVPVCVWRFFFLAAFNSPEWQSERERERRRRPVAEVYAWSMLGAIVSETPMWLHSHWKIACSWSQLMAGPMWVFMPMRCKNPTETDFLPPFAVRMFSLRVDARTWIHFFDLYIVNGMICGALVFVLATWVTEQMNDEWMASPRAAESSGTSDGRPTLFIQFVNPTSTVCHHFKFSHLNYVAVHSKWRNGGQKKCKWNFCFVCAPNHSSRIGCKHCNRRWVQQKMLRGIIATRHLWNGGEHGKSIVASCGSSHNAHESEMQFLHSLKWSRIVSFYAACTSQLLLLFPSAMRAHPANGKNRRV